MVADFYHELGYDGPPITILEAELGNDRLATVDAENNRIFINSKLLAGIDAQFLLALVSHETGHFNHYDNNASNPEATAENIANKIGTVTLTNALSSEEKAKYLNEVREKY